MAESVKDQKCQNYEHILLATDLESEEFYLRSRALELASFYGARLSAVHVIQDVPSYIEIHGYLSAVDINEKIQEEALKKFGHVGEALNINKEDLIVIHGSPKEQIVATANKLNCDLIVMGSHTRKGFAKLLGSTANGVSQSAECDLFVVKCPNS